MPWLSGTQYAILSGSRRPLLYAPVPMPKRRHAYHRNQILFLNKLDLFTEKIQHSDIKAVFPDYEGLLLCASPLRGR